ncbi:hypothetical protein V6C27_04845 [Peptococcaceae bacterium 1198_IL3148]
MMRYLLTWMEGNEVQYRFITNKDEIAKFYVEDRHVIVTPLDED